MTDTETKRKSWRDVLKIHPAADLFPMMSKEELVELGEDIKKNGLKSPVIIWSPGNASRPATPDYQLLDGRNRLDAAEAAGLEVMVSNNGRCVEIAGLLEIYHSQVVFAEYRSGERWIDPYEYVLSANAHRRHLTPEQKREVIAKVIEAKPHLSDRQIGKMVKREHKVVGRVRKQMEDVGRVPHVSKRQDTKGRAQPATKAKATAYVAAQEKRLAVAKPKQVDLEEAIAAATAPVATDEPFPSVRGGLGDNDIEATKVVEWFERRIVNGTIAPGLVALIGANLPELAHLYWGENGEARPHRLLTAEGKEKRRATMKRQHQRVLARSGVGVATGEVPDIPEALRRAH